MKRLERANDNKDNLIDELTLKLAEMERRSKKAELSMIKQVAYQLDSDNINSHDNKINIIIDDAPTNKEANEQLPYLTEPPEMPSSL